MKNHQKQLTLQTNPLPPKTPLKRKRDADTAALEGSDSEEGEAPPETASSRQQEADHHNNNHNNTNSSLPRKDGRHAGKVCNAFNNTGKCRWGTGCRYQHVRETEQERREKQRQKDKLGNSRKRALSGRSSLYQKVYIYI